ncbi:ATP-binding protein [Thaumasiovibrio subtropicus]|nr:sensor histidine kinase [Thaumasiovibrio subtropicus]
MVLILGLITLLQTGVLGQFAIGYLDKALDNQIGQQAVRVAQTIAANPAVISAIQTRDMHYLIPVSQAVTHATEAAFVVIGDHQGLRLAHPNPEKLGRSMSDDDEDQNDLVLVQGESYITKAHGSIGPSMRGKAPVFDQHGEIIGIISVGFMLDTVEATVSKHRLSMITAIALSFLFSVITAMWFANHFKKAIFDLEPEEIARLFQERNITLETVREGIVSINQRGIITTFNKAAMQTLQLDQSVNYQGLHILDVLPDSGMLDVLQSGEAQLDQEVWLQDHNLIVNRIPLTQGDTVTGVVSSFRLKNEVDLVSRKLTRIRQYAEGLRSQSHEYNNKLHTIAGLIQIGAHDKALALIGNETQHHQSFIHQLMSVTNDSVLAGCLMGKYNRARELGLTLEIEEESQMREIPAALPHDQLVSILGNLLDNALEATLSHTGMGGTVKLSMTDLGKELIFEIEDQGRGLNSHEQAKIFEQGYTTKKTEGHGIGLHLVKNLTAHLHGLITIDSPVSNQEGCRFTLYLPKSAPCESD